MPHYASPGYREEYLRAKENGEIAIDWDHDNKDNDWHDLQQELLNTYIDEKSLDGKTKIESMFPDSVRVKLPVR